MMDLSSTQMLGSVVLPEDDVEVRAALTDLDTQLTELEDRMDTEQSALRQTVDVAKADLERAVGAAKAALAGDSEGSRIDNGEISPGSAAGDVAGDEATATGAPGGPRSEDRFANLMERARSRRGKT